MIDKLNEKIKIMLELAVDSGIIDLQREIEQLKEQESAELTIKLKVTKDSGFVLKPSAAVSFSRKTDVEGLEAIHVDLNPDLPGIN